MPLTFANTFNKHTLLCTLTLRCCEKLKGSHEEMLGQHCDALLAACCGCDQQSPHSLLCLTVEFLLTRERNEGS